jgi:hypothetical protein
MLDTHSLWRVKLGSRGSLDIVQNGGWRWGWQCQYDMLVLNACACAVVLNEREG